MLTVLFITYNQKEYIEKSLDAILSQKTKYKYHIYIFDDCSNDGSDIILKKYANKYPDKITLKINQKNLGGTKNCLQGLESINSKYWCILEGDDYWCDDTKIEQQLDLLEANQDYIGCGHNTYIEKNNVINEDDLILNKNSNFSDKYNFLDIAEGKFYTHTSAIIYRYIPQLSKLIKAKHDKVSYLLGDYFNLLFHSQFGEIGYINKIMSVYRIHDKGVWSALNESKRSENTIKATLLYTKYLEKEFKKKYELPTYYTVKYYKKIAIEKKHGVFTIMKFYFLSKAIRFDLLCKGYDISKDKIFKFFHHKFYFKTAKIFFSSLYRLINFLKI